MERIFKPLVISLLIGTLLLLDSSQSESKYLIVVGLCFGLLGDIFLMGPKVNFIGGLASFLVGHVFYIWAFALEFKSITAFLVGLVISVVGLAAVGRPIVRTIVKREKKLVVPVIVYELAVSSMFAVALSTRSLASGIGSFLFLISDGILGYDRFVKKLHYGRLVIIVTYHLGQLGIVLSAFTVR